MYLPLFFLERTTSGGVLNAAPLSNLKIGESAAFKTPPLVVLSKKNNGRYILGAVRQY